MDNRTEQYCNGRLKQFLTAVDTAEYEDKLRYNAIKIEIKRCRDDNRRGIFRSKIAIECPPYCETCEATLVEKISMNRSRPVMPIIVLEQQLEVKFPLRLKRTLWQRDISRKFKMLLPSYGAKLRIHYFETHMDKAHRGYSALRQDRLGALVKGKEDDEQPNWFSFDKDAFTLCGYLQDDAMGFFGTIQIIDRIRLENGLPILPIDVVNQEITVTLTENAFDSQWEKEIVEGIRNNLLDKSVGTLKVQYGEEDYRRFQIIPSKEVKKLKLNSQ